jgi:radical SAM superfamily enzyme YgiQ (UPF0313 family)
MKRIQLIHCPDDYITGAHEKSWYLPLSLIFIATYLQQKGVEVEILDGQTLSVEEIIDRIDAPLVGANFSCISSRSMDRIAEAAKRKRALFVVGGQAATPLARQLLQFNSNIDGVGLYAGEETMLALSQGKPYAQVPNLAFRNNHGIYVPQPCDIKQFPLENAPLPNRSIKGIDLARCIDAFQKDTEGKGYPYKTIATTYSVRGCLRRLKNAQGENRACSFCSRIDDVMSIRKAEDVWEEFQRLAQSGIEMISDFSDNFSPLLGKLSAVCLERGTPWKYLRYYAEVANLTPDHIKKARMLNTNAILLGIESGDEKVLRLNGGKAYSHEFVLERMHMLKDAGIYAAPAYVLGMIGESKESVKKTVALNKAIQNLDATEISYVNILTPLPRSYAWQALMQKDKMLAKKYAGTYHINTDELERAFVDCFTSVSYDYLRKTKQKMLADCRIASTEFLKK